MIAQGDRVILLEPETGRKWLVFAEPGAVKEKGLGVWDPAKLLELPWGSPVDVAGKKLVALRPDLPDIVATLRRKAAIIQPKDASRIVHELGIQPGDRVFESGIGSGATTAALAWAVGESGRVVVQELREDFAEWASKNMERAGLGERVEVHIGDLTEAAAEGVQGPFTGALLDQPQPWLALPNLLPLMAPGGRIICYCPQVSQMEKVVATMKELSLVEVEALELIERVWKVEEHGSRPDHNGLMHTAFLIVGRVTAPS